MDILFNTETLHESYTAEEFLKLSEKQLEEIAKVLLPNELAMLINNSKYCYSDEVDHQVSMLLDTIANKHPAADKD